MLHPHQIPRRREHAVKFSEYVEQERYFSESAQEFVDIESMAFRHAIYAFRKLCEQSEFIGSNLYFAFMRYLYPPRDMIRFYLRTRGNVAVMVPGRAGSTAARSKLYGAAKAEGLKVTTHLVPGMYVEAHVDTPVPVRVRGRELARG